MSMEETSTAAPSQPPAGRSLLGTLGIGIALFGLMLGAQLLGPVLGCAVMPGALPYCGSAAATAGGEAPAPRARRVRPPQYVPLDPPLVVTFQDGQTLRFLQVAVEVMAREDRVVGAFNTHSPVIRNNLLMLLGSPTLEQLISREGKEELRLAALAEVQKILTEQTGDPGIEDLFFTSFVVQ
ncbi:MAG: flagellar basal body-associated FliL family protein [Chromatiales bacterium]|nr:flagellar basal body-associated FliL family protein [Chromatiales bacterium]